MLNPSKWTLFYNQPKNLHKTGKMWLNFCSKAKHDFSPKKWGLKGFFSWITNAYLSLLTLVNVSLPEFEKVCWLYLSLHQFTYQFYESLSQSSNKYLDYHNSIYICRVSQVYCKLSKFASGLPQFTSVYLSLPLHT